MHHLLCGILALSACLPLVNAAEDGHTPTKNPATCTPTTIQTQRHEIRFNGLLASSDGETLTVSRSESGEQLYQGPAEREALGKAIGTNDANHLLAALAQTKTLCPLDAETLKQKIAADPTSCRQYNISLMKSDLGMVVSISEPDGTILYSGLFDADAPSADIPASALPLIRRLLKHQSI